MSRKTQFLAAMMAAVARMGGSHLTREARQRTTKKFCEIMFAQGFTHLSNPIDIAGRHLRTYVSVRSDGKLGKRTLQNELAHLRSILKICGNCMVGGAPELSNRSLGINGGTRIGTKTAMTDEQLQSVRELAARQDRAGMAALVMLERRLGLRGAEAIHARSDTLARWESEIAASGGVYVIAGTKGGKPRTVQVMNTDLALEAIQYARRIADLQGSYLVTRADARPAGGLKQARSIYHAWSHRAGIQPHSARYAFAQDQIRARIAKGYSEREALIAASHDLGHGDGRGRWVKSVYMQ